MGTGSERACAGLSQKQALVQHSTCVYASSQVMTGKSKFGSACAFVEMADLPHSILAWRLRLLEHGSWQATPSEAEIALKAIGPLI